MPPLNSLPQPNNDEEENNNKDEEISFDTSETTLEASIEAALAKDDELEGAHDEFVKEMSDINDKESTAVMFSPNQILAGEYDTKSQMESLESVLEKREDIQFDAEEYEDSDELESSDKIRFRKLFWGGAFLLVGLFFLWEGLYLPQAVNITFLSVWPLVFITLGLFILSNQNWLNKMLKVFMVVILIVLVLGVFGGNRNLLIPTSGVIVEDVREIINVNRIVLEGDGNVSVNMGEDETLMLIGDENLVKSVVTDVNDGLLRISYSEQLFQNDNTSIDIIVTVKNIEAVHLLGAGQITALHIETENVELFVSGSGKMNLNVDTETLMTKIVGDGSITITGTTNRQVVLLEGSGSYNGASLSSIEAGVRVNGPGEIRIFVEDELNAVSIGGGRIIYSGSPSISLSDVSGNGTIRKISTLFDGEILNDDIILQLQKLDKVKAFEFE